MAEAWEDFGAEPEGPSWEDFGAPSAPASAIDPLAGGALQAQGDAPGVKQSTWARRLKEAQGVNPGLDPENQFGGEYSVARPIADAAARGFEYLAAGTNTALEGLDEVSKDTWMTKLPAMVGLDPILPGTAIGGFGEAFPLGGLETGHIPTPRGKGDFMSPEARAGLDDLYAKGTADEILSYAKENGATIDEAQLREWVDYRNKENPELVKPEYRSLEDEAAAFTPSKEPTPEDLFGPEPTFEPDFLKEKLTTPEPEVYEGMGPQAPARVEDLWPTEESRATDLSAIEQSLADEAAAWKTSKETFEDFKPDETPAVPDEHVQSLESEVNRVTEGWANSPGFKVVRSAEDIEDPALRAAVEREGINPKAVIDDQGQVHVFADQVRPEDIPAIAFHEGLGHHGLTQVFGEGLDAQLTNMYDNSPWLKSVVDKWQAENPGAYDGSVARAADEVLAELSEGGPRERQMAARIMDQVKNEIKKFARQMGMTVEYSEREVRSILDMAHSAVINGKPSAAANGFRFMRNRDPKSMTPETVKTTKDVDDLFRFAEEETKAERVNPYTVEEVQRAADALDMTASKYLKGKNIADDQVATRIMAGRKLLANQAESLGKIMDKIDQQGLTPSLKAESRQKLGVYFAVYSKLRNEVGELGRAMRMLQEDVTSKAQGKAAGRFMDENGGISILGDDEAIVRFLQNVRALERTEGVEAAMEHIQNVKKVKAEDYVGSVIYNFMLSNPKTWVRNFMGAPMVYAWDLAMDSAKIMSPVGRAELKGRITGPLAAFSKANIYKTLSDTADSFKTGQSMGYGIEAKTGSKDLVFSNSDNKFAKVAGWAIENPQRIMAATDQFWTGVLHMGNLYGEAAVTVAMEGLRGEAAAKRLAELVANPTSDLLAHAEKVTNRQLFRDHEDMTSLARGITDLQRSRYEDQLQIIMKEDENGRLRPTAKTTLPANTPGERLAKFAFKTAVPFVPTIDSIARTVVRNSGPLGLLSKRLRSEIMDPATRAAALGRMSVSSAVMGLVAHKAMNGELTGAETGDYKKSSTTSAMNPPMSIKIGDKWVSYQGLDPIAGQLSLVATGVEAARSKQDFEEVVLEAAIGSAASLKENSYGESLSTLIKMLGESSAMVSEGKGIGPATSNFAIGQAANLATPGIAKFTDDLVDNNRRDTTGDGSFEDRTVGRIKGGLPGLSDDLPARHDVYGREVTKDMAGGIIQVKDAEESPAIQELDRLEKTTDEVVVGAPKKNPVKVGDETRRLTAEEFQEYQQISGDILVQVMDDIVADEGYQSLSDEDKILMVTKIRDRVRKKVREALFSENPEEEGEQ